MSETADFLKLVYNGGSGYVCVTVGKTKDDFFAWPDQADAAEAYILAHGATSDVYVCTQLVDSPTDRKKSNIQRAHVVHADLDHCDPDKLLVKPSLLVESSRGRYQAWWLLDGSLSPAQEAENISRRIARFHKADGCDTGWNINRILRVPGTLNHKYDPAQPVSIKDHGPSFYRTDDFSKYPMLPTTLSKIVELPDLVDLPD